MTFAGRVCALRTVCPSAGGVELNAQLQQQLEENPQAAQGQHRVPHRVNTILTRNDLERPE